MNILTLKVIECEQNYICKRPTIKQKYESTYNNPY